ncbi:hypothetical protein [Anabaena subtropica]|uniref:Uncharacterized protein n=1 Tax=Anabaena subtropica FACHB-260 TaxID=2692884 RepID=A0ABR8CMJ9_9NOST|nr:hypothetical protein [Anabaena subtropica]MBD2343783.1 hypothetical protein [Anabaena subtropica FACHB-260]
MPSRLYTETKNTRKYPSAFSHASSRREIFQSRPFVVQSKQTKLNQPNLKTSLMQAEKYGHHLNQTHPTNFVDTTVVQQKKAFGSNNSPIIQMASPKADAAAKQKLGPVPGTFSLPDKPSSYPGTYAGQFNRHKLTPSGQSVEVDHMTPDSLHQPLGQGRKTSPGTKLSRRLPTAAISKLLHRRKNTTDSGKEVEHQRAYLLHAHHGMVPFAGRMESQQDYYGAAMELDLRHTFGRRAVFGEPSLHDPRPVKPTQQGVVPFGDLSWSVERMNEMYAEAARQGRIQPENAKHLQSVAQEELQTVKGQYPKSDVRPDKPSLPNNPKPANRQRR